MYLDGRCVYTFHSSVLFSIVQTKQQFSHNKDILVLIIYE